MSPEDGADLLRALYTLQATLQITGPRTAELSELVLDHTRPPRDAVERLACARFYGESEATKRAVSPASQMGPLDRWFCQRHGTTPVASHGTT